MPAVSTRPFEPEKESSEGPARPGAAIHHSGRSPPSPAPLAGRSAIASPAGASSNFPIPPLAWEACPFASMVSSGGGRWAGPLVRWWRNAPAEIEQPALDQHLLAMHLGSPNCLRRLGNGTEAVTNVDTGALSIAPAGTAYRWTTTDGPAELAHIYLCPRLMQQVAVEEFGRDTGALDLGDPLGMRDPLLQTLFLEILEQTAGATRASRLYVDTLLRSLLLRLIRTYGDAPALSSKARLSIAPFRLRRVIDFVEANIASDLALADLAAVAGASPFHFSRAFAGAMGMPPYAYLLSRRIEAAKALLIASSDPMARIADQCGFNSAAQLSRMFKNITGSTPVAFRFQAAGCDEPRSSQRSRA